MSERIEIECEGCGNVYGTAQRRRSVHCPKCQKSRYVPLNPRMSLFNPRRMWSR